MVKTFLMSLNLQIEKNLSPNMRTAWQNTTGHCHHLIAIIRGSNSTPATNSLCDLQAHHPPEQSPRHWQNMRVGPREQEDHILNKP